LKETGINIFISKFKTFSNLSKNLKI